MFKKNVLIFALGSLFSMPVFASVGEVEHGEGAENGYEVEHQELDDDLQRNLGLSVSRDATGHIEIDDGNGHHYSYTLQSTGTTGTGCPSGQTVCYQDSGDGRGSLAINYSSGKGEIATAESHNQAELNEHANQLGFSVTSKTNGVMTVRETASGNEFRVRTSAQMVRGPAGLNPGIRLDSGGRILERYSDGWEQEILAAN